MKIRFYFLTLLSGAIMATTGCSKDNTEPIRYKLGDYWPDPQVVYDPDWPGTVSSGTGAQGIVFWLDETEGYDAATGKGIHGKIISLEQVFLPWGPEGQDEQAAGVQGIRSWEYGYTATRNMIAKYCENANFATEYPVFNWIYEKNGRRPGELYLPALNEMEELNAFLYGRTNIDHDRGRQINAAILAAGGHSIIPTAEGYYYAFWTSTEVYTEDPDPACGGIRKCSKALATYEICLDLSSMCNNVRYCRTF